MTTNEFPKILNGYHEWIAAPARERSGESDYGVWWHRATQPRGPFWRISWIEATDELYAVQEGADNYFVIGLYPNEVAVKGALAGWGQAMQDLDAIVRQARTGVPAPHWPEDEPAKEDGSGIDLSGVNFGPLEFAVAEEDRLERAEKVYRGRQAPDSQAGDFHVVVIEGGRARPLAHIVRHSPDGFGCGYSGSGAADLALSILADYFREQPVRPFSPSRYRACQYYQAFKRAFIATADERSLRVTSDQIKAWLASQDRE